MKRIFLVVIVAFTILSGCHPGSVNDKDSVTSDNVYNIELINNEKWLVVEEMMTHIKNMNKEVYDFNPQDSYSDLASSLKDHIALLTSNCTMTGQGHDELHKWLLPYIDLVDDLSNASSEADKEYCYLEIKKSFEEFNKYFE